MSDDEQTLRALANNFGSGNPTFNGFTAGADSNRQQAYAACLSGADALVRAKQTCGNCGHFADERESAGFATGYCAAPSGNFYSGRVMESSARCERWATREAE